MRLAKSGPRLVAELARFRAVDQGADQVGGQQVGRELDALEARLDAGAQGLDGQGLGEAGHAFEQHVAVGEQADEQAVHEVFLADDDAAQLALQAGRSSGCAPARRG